VDGVLDPELMIWKTFRISINHVTGWAFKDSMKAFIDKETSNSSLNEEL